MKGRFIFMLLILMLVAASCATFRVGLPEGFALVQEGAEFVAVSPEGLTYRVKTEANYPEKNVDFWSGAMKRQLEEEGYKLRSEGEFFECPAGRGYFIEWNVPHQGETFIYMTGIVPAGGALYVAEAAAEHTIYKTYRDAIIESLESIASE